MGALVKILMLSAVYMLYTSCQAAGPPSLGGLTSYKDEPVVRRKDRVFVLYYLPGCPACEQMMEDFDALGSVYNGITIRKTSVAPSWVRSFPTLMLGDVEYTGPRTYIAFTNFLDRV